MNTITVSTTINAPIEKVWEYYTSPEHITQWAFASDDWEAPYAENDLTVGGKFITRMASKDGKNGFDFGGTYTVVEPLRRISYTIGDGRAVDVQFSADGDSVNVTVEFETENQNSREKQQQGWQAILDNFKKHVEMG